MRRNFLALCWPDDHQDARVRASQIAARLDATAAWTRAGALDGLIVWTDVAAPLPVMRLPRGEGFIVGDLFDHPGVARSRSPLQPDGASWADSEAIARRLTEAHWGQYIAVLKGPSARDAAIFRDPTGMLDCVTWRLGDHIQVVASDMTRAPGWLQARQPFLNWDRIAAFTAAPAAASTPALFDDVEAVGPGELLVFKAASHRTVVIWSPVDFAATPIDDVRALADELVRRVDVCTKALIGGYAKVLMELSGGLDSSVLAGAIEAVGLTPRVVQWFNLANARSEADESRYARAVTERLGVALTVEGHEPGALNEADFAEVAQAFWPAGGAMDAARDRGEVARVGATGAQAIVSGQGGDAAFFQMPSALVAADEFQRRGWSAIASPVLADVARRTRQSVWSVLGQVRSARRGRFVEPKLKSSLVSREVGAMTAGLAHAWVDQAQRADLPAGKRFHISVMANTHLNHVGSRRRQVADLLFPLLSQPIIELCLAAPTPVLAGASFDRPFERSTFAHRIPEAVRLRRSKGDLSVYYSHLVTQSLPTLRPYLLEGCLCAAGVLDRRLLEELLDPNRLIWSGTPSDILWAAIVEGWVRHWQTRTPDSPHAVRARV